jgi:hypothetical protein
MNGIAITEIDIGKAIYPNSVTRAEIIQLKTHNWCGRQKDRK